MSFLDQLRTALRAAGGAPRLPEPAAYTGVRPGGITPRGSVSDSEIAALAARIRQAGPPGVRTRAAEQMSLEQAAQTAARTAGTAPVTGSLAGRARGTQGRLVDELRARLEALSAPVQRSGGYDYMPGNFAASTFGIPATPFISGAALRNPDMLAALRLIADEIGVNRNLPPEALQAEVASQFARNAQQDYLDRLSRGGAAEPVIGPRPGRKYAAEPLTVYAGGAGPSGPSVSPVAPGQGAPSALEPLVPIETEIPGQPIPRMTGAVDAEGKPIPRTLEGRQTYLPGQARRAVVPHRNLDGDVTPVAGAPEFTVIGTRRTGSDGNRSPEVVEYVLPREDGSFQVSRINDDGGYEHVFMSPDELAKYGASRGYSLISGPQLRLPSSGLPVDGAAAEAVGRALFESVRGGTPNRVDEALGAFEQLRARTGEQGPLWEAAVAGAEAAGPLEDTLQAARSLAALAEPGVSRAATSPGDPARTATDDVTLGPGRSSVASVMQPMRFDATGSTDTISMDAGFSVPEGGYAAPILDMFAGSIPGQGRMGAGRMADVFGGQAAEPAGTFGFQVQPGTWAEQASRSPLDSLLYGRIDPSVTSSSDVFARVMPPPDRQSLAASLEAVNARLREMASPREQLASELAQATDPRRRAELIERLGRMARPSPNQTPSSVLLYNLADRADADLIQNADAAELASLRDSIIDSLGRSSQEEAQGFSVPVNPSLQTVSTTPVTYTSTAGASSYADQAIPGTAPRDVASADDQSLARQGTVNRPSIVQGDLDPLPADPSGIYIPPRQGIPPGDGSPQEAAQLDSVRALLRKAADLADNPTDARGRPVPRLSVTELSERMTFEPEYVRLSEDYRAALAEIMANAGSDSDALARAAGAADTARMSEVSRGFGPRTESTAPRPVVDENGTPVPEIPDARVADSPDAPVRPGDAEMRASAEGRESAANAAFLGRLRAALGSGDTQARESLREAFREISGGDLPIALRDYESRVASDRFSDDAVAKLRDLEYEAGAAREALAQATPANTPRDVRVDLANKAKAAQKRYDDAVKLFAGDRAKATGSQGSNLSRLIDRAISASSEQDRLQALRELFEIRDRRFRPRPGEGAQVKIDGLTALEQLSQRTGMPVETIIETVLRNDRMLTDPANLGAPILKGDQVVTPMGIGNESIRDAASGLAGLARRSASRELRPSEIAADAKARIEAGVAPDFNEIPTENVGAMARWMQSLRNRVFGAPETQPEIFAERGYPTPERIGRISSTSEADSVLAQINYEFESDLRGAQLLPEDARQKFLSDADATRKELLRQLNNRRQTVAAAGEQSSRWEARTGEEGDAEIANPFDGPETAAPVPGGERRSPLRPGQAAARDPAPRTGSATEIAIESELDRPPSGVPDPAGAQAGRASRSMETAREALLRITDDNGSPLPPHTLEEVRRLEAAVGRTAADLKTRPLQPRPLTDAARQPKNWWEQPDVDASVEQPREVLDLQMAGAQAAGRLEAAQRIRELRQQQLAALDQPVRSQFRVTEDGFERVSQGDIPTPRAVSRLTDKKMRPVQPAPGMSLLVPNSTADRMLSGEFSLAESPEGRVTVGFAEGGESSGIRYEGDAVEAGYSVIEFDQSGRPIKIDSVPDSGVVVRDQRAADIDAPSASSIGDSAAAAEMARAGEDAAMELTGRRVNIDPDQTTRRLEPAAQDARRPELEARVNRATRQADSADSAARNAEGTAPKADEPSSGRLRRMLTRKNATRLAGAGAVAGVAALSWDPIRQAFVTPVSYAGAQGSADGDTNSEERRRSADLLRRLALANTMTAQTPI